MALFISCILAVSALELVKSSEAVAEGGPSGFGYDASSACSKPYSRTGRARLENLPCDFSRENWCTIAGNAYPWHAVRRFVQENQGLMRRMYGDEKHISVLKTELEKNDVELELEGDHNHLYSEEPKQFQFDMDYELEEDSSLDSRRKLARALNSGTSSKFEKPEERHVHPNETPSGSLASSTASSSSSSSSSTSPSPSSSSSSSVASATASSTASTTSSTTASPAATTPNPPSTLIQASTRTSSTASATPTTEKTHRTKMTPITSTASSLSSASTTASSPASPEPPSLDKINNIQNLSINEIPGQIDRFDSDVDELTEIAETTVSTLNADQDFGAEFEELEEPSESQHQQHQFRPRPEYRPGEAAKPESTISPEAQLFQDVAAKDKQEAPVLKVRGINACPVKEEVVAPFWANNTRGEVLALLNLYPFEQYVHWEKCTHENKQMYCRDGCRCEQQYRLHRLLAYDPNNECRGIFSDWFKFPSCCICRCYDLPIEFRVTSRSPRLVQRQKIRVRAPRRHRAPRQRPN